MHGHIMNVSGAENVTGHSMQTAKAGQQTFEYMNKTSYDHMKRVGSSSRVPNTIPMATFEYMSMNAEYEYSMQCIGTYILQYSTYLHVHMYARSCTKHNQKKQ